MRLALSVVIIGFAVLAIFDIIDRISLSEKLQVEELLILRASYLKKEAEEKIVTLLSEPKINYSEVLKILKDNSNYKA